MEWVLEREGNIRRGERDIKERMMMAPVF